MPPLSNFPHIKRTPMVVPTKDYPWLKNLMKQVDFACASCSSAQGQAVHYTLEEAILDPISGAPTKGGGIISAKGMIATRFLVMCPVDRTVPENSPLMPGGFCDLMDIDPKYKRPHRAAGAGDGITYDGDDDDAEEASLKPRKFGSSRLKKVTDLPKPVKLSAKDKKLVAAALESNKAEVPASALQPSQRGGSAPKATKKKK